MKHRLVRVASDKKAIAASEFNLDVKKNACSASPVRDDGVSLCHSQRSMPSPPRKFHIVGGPGSGKTTVSRRLATLLDVPLFELDAVAGAGWAPAFRIQRPLADRLAQVYEIATSPAWITEGTFLWWTEKLFREADIIIWLDVPAHVAMRRVLMRHAQEYGSAINRQTTMSGKLKAVCRPYPRHLAAFTAYTWAYYHRTTQIVSPSTDTMDDGWALTHTNCVLQLQAHQHKVVHCTRDSDVETLLQHVVVTNATSTEEVTMPASDTTRHIPPVTITSKYADLHKADWIPVDYDENIYDPGGYDTFIWEVYRPRLVQIVERLTHGRDHAKYLDFACGTGRITLALEALVTESYGLDVSPQMIDYAKSKVSRTTLVAGDLLADPALVGTDFDIITAFRFFVNTEPEMRGLVMHSLANRLSDSTSRLIFNVHMNRWGAYGIKSLYRRVRGWGKLTTLSYPEVRRLVKDAGLEIETWSGFGLWPDRAYRSRVGPLVKLIDRVATHIRPLRWISKDMLFVCRPPAIG